MTETRKLSAAELEVREYLREQLDVYNNQLKSAFTERGRIASLLAHQEKTITEWAGIRNAIKAFLDE